jgi:hypothetical protein
VLPQPFRICVKRVNPIRPAVVSPRAHGSGASETPGSENTAEWKGRPLPPPPPPLPRRLQAQLQEETFRKDKRRRRPRDPQTGKYKRSNKMSSKALEKRELRKRIHRLVRKKIKHKHHPASSKTRTKVRWPGRSPQTMLPTLNILGWDQVLE